MFENFLGMIRKRRRTDSGSGAGGAGNAESFFGRGFSVGVNNSNNSCSQNSSTSAFAAASSSSNSNSTFWDSFFRANTNANALSNNEQQQQQQQQLISSACKDVIHVTEQQVANNGNVENFDQFEDMDIDQTPGPATSTQQQQQEYLNNLLKSSIDSNSNSEETRNLRGVSPMNFDYLHGLHESSSGSGVGSNLPTNTGSAREGSSGSNVSAGSSSRYFDSVGGSVHQIVDDSRVIDRPFDLNERFVTVLDHLDAHVEKFRKEAMTLQEKRDYLLMSIDLIKSNDLLHTMSEAERDEIHTYITRVNSRLGTVEINVRTIRDTSQEDSLSQINALIDVMITMGDPVLSRQRCQQYLNACCSSAETGDIGEHYSEVNVFVQESSGMETDMGPIDKKFESVLLGCTLDDQKNIKKRLQALMDYLNKQTISH